MRVTILEAQLYGCVKVLYQPEGQPTSTSIVKVSDLPSVSDEFTGHETSAQLQGRSFETKPGAGLFASGILPPA